MKIVLGIVNFLCVAGLLLLGTDTVFCSTRDRGLATFPIAGAVLLSLTTVLVLKGYYPRLSKELAKLRYETEILKKQVEIKGLRDKLGTKGGTNG